jgi:molybdate transport repressor ModE-like protein
LHRLQFHYTLSRDNTPAQVRNPLIDLLQAVATGGSISAAARTLNLSYRHVWGELKRWEDELGNELLVWDKGKSARLSEFGAKLMWAERQAQARLAPQIEALRADLERAFAVAFDADSHVLTLYASHDDGLAALREHALAWGLDGAGQLHLDIRFCGSVDAIRALNEGRCALAGFHTLQHPAPGSLAERTYKPLLKPGLHKIIGFAVRTQGLMVAAGNPLALRSLHDVQRTQSRFVNRALGTGTRVVLDELLSQQRLPSTEILGYGRTEPSHTAVAHAVASASADVGLGIAAAAHAQGLDFVPLVQESYHLVCLKSALEEPAIAALRALLQTPEWQTTLRQVGDYVPEHCGQVQALRRVLPWWDFTKPKTNAT